VTAYVIFIRESPVRDPAEMDAYQKQNRQGPRDPNLKPLALYGAMEALEGKLPDGIVLLQFPSVADAKAWYHSPNYQAAVPHRLKAADYRGIIVEGL
jgi:uncharacterized protein (DUF1330 family)